MILIADSGSTKCDWLIISKQGKTLQNTIHTKGLNPAILSAQNLFEIINQNEALNTVKNDITKVFFYGAGCGTEKPREILYTVLKQYFAKAKIVVKEDTYAAVYATLSTPKQAAIVCILGTGSNCSYYDGKQLHQRVDALGYSIMDDASGNYFGRQLLRDYYFNTMPKDLKIAFANKYDLSADTIKHNLYKQAHPNAYLASFAEFMASNKSSNYINNLIKEGIRLFIKTMILQYQDILQTTPVHFVGSISYVYQNEIREVAKALHITVGNFEQRPINGLIKYHIANA